MKAITRIALVSAVTTICASAAIADHRWNGYHWSRSGPEITPPVGDNVSGAWDSYLQVAVNGGNGKPGWNTSTVIDSALVAGSVTNPKTCKPVAGTIQVCDARYGRNGWLGIAQIWLSGGHITQGVTKLNNTYFETPTYNSPPWRRLVMCQEVGHDYGLGHTNEIFSNVNDGTCMDYTNAPAGGILNGFNYGSSNEYPNGHDFDELESIYGGHSETNFGVSVVGQARPAGPPSEAPGGDTPAEWGRAIHFDGEGRPDVFEMTVATGRKKITHVFWAVGEGPRGGHHHDDH